MVWILSSKRFIFRRNTGLVGTGLLVFSRRSPPGGGGVGATTQFATHFFGAAGDAGENTQFPPSRLYSKSLIDLLGGIWNFLKKNIFGIVQSVISDPVFTRIISKQDSGGHNGGFGLSWGTMLPLVFISLFLYHFKMVIFFGCLWFGFFNLITCLRTNKIIRSIQRGSRCLIGKNCFYECFENQKQKPL